MPEKCVINEVGWEQLMKSWFWMVWRWSRVPLFMAFIPFAAELEPCLFTSCHDPSSNFGVDPTQAASFWCTSIAQIYFDPHNWPWFTQQNAGFLTQNLPGWYPLLTRTPRCSPCDSMVVGIKPCKDTSFVKRQPGTFTIWMPSVWMPSVCDLFQEDL